MAVKCLSLNLFLIGFFLKYREMLSTHKLLCWDMKFLEDFRMGYKNLKQNLNGLQVFLRKNYISFRPGPGY